MKLPPINLNHLKKLTDDTGILQHAKYSTPRRTEGYTTDDNARALIACIKHNQFFSPSETEKLIQIYLSFLLHMQRSDGKFHNFLSYQRHFQDDVGSEDSMGRALWACGYTMSADTPKDEKYLSKEIFDRGFKWANTFESPRAIAYTLLGLQHYKKAYPKDENIIIHAQTLADQLCELYQHTSKYNWQWFERYLTYANARLPHALFEAYVTTKKGTYLKIAEKALKFLIQNQIIEDTLLPIGNGGFYIEHHERAFYDQQPLETACIIGAATMAFSVTRKEKYRKVANIAFEWFLGKNSQHLEVYNRNTGGCYDGITAHGINLNQGAESTISYLLSRLNLESMKNIETQ